MVKSYWDIRNDKILKDKGVYVISTDKLALENFYKVGYSGSSLKNRINQINEILSPALNEKLNIYAVIIPKPGKSGVKQNIRAKELNQIEKTIHQYYKQKGCLSVIPHTKKYSEWLYSDIEKLIKVMNLIIDDETYDYKINFKVIKL